MGMKDPKLKRDLDTGEIITQETFEDIHEDHRPVTRRDFLAAGLIQMTASVTLPSVVALLAKSGNVQAQETLCAKGANSTLAPFITVNLAGGAGLASNFVPHDQGQQPLSSYTKLGLGLTSTLPIEYGFSNNAPFAGNGISQFYTGLQATANALTLVNASFVAAPVRTRDDSSDNKLNLEGMVAKAGRAGSILPHLGQNQNAFAFVPPPNPLNISRFSNIEEALNIGGRLGEILSPQQQASIFKTIESLTSVQTRGIASKTGGAELSKILNCATKDNTDLVGNPDPGVNPIADPAFLSLWGNNNNIPQANSQEFTQAALVYNVIKGNAAAGTINLGGYDYHNGTRATGDGRDNQAGQLVGRILQSFAQQGTKGFVVVTTDGSVTGPTTNTPDGPWTSDRGSAGMAYMIAYDPAKPPTASGFQMGHFLSGGTQQAVDQSFLTSGTPEMAAAGIFANYLSFNGQARLIEAVIPRIFSTSDLDTILKIFP